MNLHSEAAPVPLSHRIAYLEILSSQVKKVEDCLFAFLPMLTHHQLTKIAKEFENKKEGVSRKIPLITV